MNLTLIQKKRKKSDAERDKCSKEERDVWYKLYRIGLTRITCSFSLNNGDVGNVHCHKTQIRVLILQPCKCMYVSFTNLLL